MKKIITLAALLSFAAPAAFALPVLNKNTPGAETVTVFPDHSDPNLYYTAPTVFTISKNEAGVPNFSYIEYLTGGYRRAFIQATLRPNFTYSEMEKAKQNILAINPSARFTALPFEKASVSFTDSLKVLMVDSDCQHPAGTVGDEQTCAFHLRNQGVKVLRPMLKKGLAITTQFVYTINGVRQNADGTYVNQFNTYQVAGRIGGPDLAAHPELFQDYKGNVINGLLPSIAGFLEMNAELTSNTLALASLASEEDSSALPAPPSKYVFDQDENGVPRVSLERSAGGGAYSFVMKPIYEPKKKGQGYRTTTVPQPYAHPWYALGAKCDVLPDGRIGCRFELNERGVEYVLSRLNQGLSTVSVDIAQIYEGAGWKLQLYSVAYTSSDYFKEHPLR